MEVAKKATAPKVTEGLNKKKKKTKKKKKKERKKSNPGEILLLHIS